MKNTLLIESNRNLFVDVIKAFAIILVVVGHCIQYGAGNVFMQEKLFYDDMVFKAIYSFHMPLFMLVSGYLFASTRHKSIKDVVVGKFRSLVIPILCWNTIPIVCYIAQLIINDNFSILVAIKYAIGYNIGSFWFLWAVFGCSCIVILISKAFKDRLWVYVFLFLMTFVIPDDFNIFLYKYMYPFFVVGYLYGKNNLKEKWMNIYSKKSVVVLLGLTFVALLCFFNKDSFIYTSGYTLLGRDWATQLYIDLYRFVVGFVGSGFAIVSLYNIYKVSTVRKWIRSNKIILTIGQNSLGIYIVSTFINVFILTEVTKSLMGVNVVFIAIETVGVLILSILITKAIQRSNFLNMYLLGKYKR